MGLLDFGPIAFVRAFLERGGDVLFVIGAVTFVMWTLILERAWYFRFVQPREAKRVNDIWQARSDHHSWHAGQIRRLLVSEVRAKLNQSVGTIKTLIAVCPMLGLLGTVTGMIEVFDVMAVGGGGNTRAMASGVSKATIPTMAGMVAALSGMILSIQIERFAKHEAERVEDHLTPEEE